MKTRICDICGRNVSEIVYKVKKRDLGLNDVGYHRLDICPVCFVAFKKLAMEQHKKYQALYNPDTNEANNDINDVEKTSETETETIENFLQSVSEKETYRIINTNDEVLSCVIIDNELTICIRKDTSINVSLDEVINPRTGKTIFYINNKWDCASAKSFVKKFMQQ